MISLSIWLRMLHGMFVDLYMCFRIATVPTLKAIWDEPSLLLRPRAISQTFMNYVWEAFGDGVDQNGREEKENLITPWAYGVVLEISAAHGHLAIYLDRTRVTAYIALEPNVNMHDRLRAKAREFGFEEEKGSFLLLPFGVEDYTRIGQTLDEWVNKWSRADDNGRTVDTIVSVLTLCSVPHRPRPASLNSNSNSTPNHGPASAHISTPPAEVVRALQSRILRPGGQILFYEHVRSPIPSVARAQDLLAPIWSTFFDGCTIGVDSVRAIWEAGYENVDLLSSGQIGIEDLRKTYHLDWTEKDGVKCWKSRNEERGGWAEMCVWSKKVDAENPATLFWHQLGRCVKRA